MLTAFITGLNLAIMYLAFALLLRGFKGWRDIKHPFLQSGVALTALAAGVFISPARLLLQMGLVHDTITLIIVIGLCGILAAFISWNASIEHYRHGHSRKRSLLIWSSPAVLFTAIGVLVTLWIG